MPARKPRVSKADSVFSHSQTSGVRSQMTTPSLFPRGRMAAGSLSAAEVVQLQRVIGNQAVGRLLQRKEILNLASGTNVENLMTPMSEEDQVINLDRGDMLIAQVVLEHYPLFAEEIEEALEESDKQKAVRSAESRAKKSEGDLGEQVRKEKLNLWMYGPKYYKGDIDQFVQERVNTKAIRRTVPWLKEPKTSPLSQTLAGKKSALLGANKGFIFGEVSEQMPFTDGRFDEIHMTSGYGIKIVGEVALAQEIARILKAGGKLILTGNLPVLRSNGFKITKTGEGVALPGAAADLFDLTEKRVEGQEVTDKSEHTLGGGFGEEQFHTIVLQKKS